MSNTAAAIGKGTTLGFFVGTGTPTFVVIAEILELKMPKHGATPVEIERYDGPSLFPELITSWAKGGELEYTLTYTAAQASALWAAFNVLGQYQVTKPDGKTWTYNGIMTSFGDVLPLKDKMTIDCTVMISGAPVPSSTSA